MNNKVYANMLYLGMQLGEDFSISREAKSFIETTFCPFWADELSLLSAMFWSDLRACAMTPHYEKSLKPVYPNKTFFLIRVESGHI